MTERTNAQINTEMFFDLLGAAIKNEEIGKMLHNHTAVLLPQDNPELCASNLESSKKLPQTNVIFIEVSKSEGSKDYDVFQIKEPPINL